MSNVYFCAVAYLAGVLSSLEEAGTEHGGGDPVGVGALTVLLRQDGQVQAVQALRTADWTTNKKRDILYGLIMSQHSNEQNQFD